MNALRKSMSQAFKDMNNIQRGFISGIALSLLVGVGIFSAVHTTNAQGGEQLGNTSALVASTDTPTTTSTTGTAAVTDTPSVANTPASATPPTPLPRTTAYVGLGDSVAAGDGLQTWATATAEDLSCKRSPYSYVFEVGRELKRPHAPYACSGATAANMNHQLDEAFAQGVPAVISITAGANDLGWDQIIKSCYTGDCNSAGINDKLVAVQTNLLNVMQQIQTRSGGGVPPKVILTGYYNPISANCATATNGKLSAFELDWITSGVKALNETIKGVAGTYGIFATYADVNFAGHDICSATPWVQGLTGVAPLHPNEAGQNAIAASVMSVARPYALYSAVY